MGTNCYLIGNRVIWVLLKEWSQTLKKTKPTQVVKIKTAEIEKSGYCWTFKARLNSLPTTLRIVGDDRFNSIAN